MEKDGNVEWSNSWRGALGEADSGALATHVSYDLFVFAEAAERLCKSATSLP